MHSFDCFSIAPISLPNIHVAIATHRAGGIGILDTEFYPLAASAAEPLAMSATEPQHQYDLAATNLDRLLAATTSTGRVGLRLHGSRLDLYRRFLDKLAPIPHWVILCGWEPHTLKQQLEYLGACSNRHILLEVLSLASVRHLDLDKLSICGMVAKGYESGGWVGEDSSFILTQKLLNLQSQPVYVQGGIGTYTAAACRAAGAAGVILDDQLWFMPESALPPESQRHLKQASGREAIAMGERLDAPCRVFSRPGFAVISTLQQLAERLETLSDNPEENTQAWRQQVNSLLGWEAPGVKAWPMGQAVGLAAEMRDRYGTTEQLVRTILDTQIPTHSILNPQSPFARSHGVEYPIVQGPMTRVSDNPEFAGAVAQAGGLPTLALALLKGDTVRQLLRDTKARLGDRQWGVGILGFVPHELRQEQLAVVREIKPHFAIIAGGRPDAAARLEAEGIPTYIHVPTPTLLEQFLEQGATRFVFEGRECGGHVGPLSSSVLWESAIAVLLRDVPAERAGDIHVLFAGGIHDRRSAQIVAATSAPLAERGMKVGVLVGTAYLFTQEAVASGAIVPEFQAQALHCDRTVNLETGPGHASRCAVTPFSQEFYATRRQMIAAGYPAEQIKDTLENLTLGRLRIASKGIARNANGTKVAVSTHQQIQEGMYMIGQVATLRDRTVTIRELHQDICSSPDGVEHSRNVAIIGMATLLPKASYPEQFWDNLLARVSAISEIPSHRWDWRLYYDSDRHRRDKVYSKWGGFIDDVPFDPLQFGIPPKSLKSIEPLQLLALEAVRRALDDAGYGERAFDRENTSVILGAGGGIADLGQQYAVRSEIPRFVGSVGDATWDRLPEWTEESFPGLLLNVVAGRITNRFGLGGENFTVDAACGSSLAAVNLAVQSLTTGQSNVAIAGGVDTCQSPFAYLCFSKTQALSPQGKACTFDRNADGIVISEGIGIVVLKRLDDARRDGDRIYGVIKSVAGSSDGKALGLTAPHPAGQRRAVERAYHQAGIDPKTVSLYEAHGTGTAAGDRAELETWWQTLTERQAPAKSCAMGSVKTLIGHTKSTAGVTGLIKVALSLYHRVLPPHVGVDRPLEPIADPNSPVYLLKQARPWLKHPEYPRRAAVSAFGFGGTNFHAVLEEGPETSTNRSVGSPNWPWELFLFRASDRRDLQKQIDTLRQQLEAGASPRLRDLAYSTICVAAKQEQLAVSAVEAQPVCLSIVADSLEACSESLKLIRDRLASSESDPLPPHIQLGWQASPKHHKIAFLFPGQGSQYPDMAREIALYFPEMRASLEMADQQLRDRLPKLLSQYIYPPGAYSEAEEQRYREELTDTRVAQSAIGTVELGFLQIARRLGIAADCCAGHSYGEYAALHAAGVFEAADFLQLSALRGGVMASACESTPGSMAVVRSRREDLLVHLKGSGGVAIANHNAPLQSVISGNREAVQAAVERLNAQGIEARLLPVSGAFHTCLIAEAQQPLADAIATTPMRSPQIPVYGNATARPYPNHPDSIRSQLSKHLLAPVEFVRQIEAIYESGVRVFLELGPKSVLAKLSDRILEGREHQSISLDGTGGGLRGMLIALGNLATYGVSSNLTALFDGRDVRQLDLTDLVAQTRQPPLPPHMWLLNGGSIRPVAEPVGHSGKLPPLTLETMTPSASNLAIVANPNPPSLPQIPTMTANAHSFPPSSSSERDRLAAYQSYQETMRQFLSVQEQVMLRYLAAGSLPTPASANVEPPVPLSQTESQVPAPTPWESELRAAWEQGQFRMQYQPIVSLGNPRIAGFEALLRWYHPQRGWISTTDIIATAQQIGLMEALGQWTLSCACHHLRQGQQKLAVSAAEPMPQPFPMNLCVNLCHQQFYNPNLVEQVGRTLLESGWQGQYLKLEVADSIWQADPERAIAIVEQLRSLQVGVYIDNFDVTRNDRHDWERLPVEAVKLDRTFVSSLPAQNQGDVQELLERIRGLGIQSIATGVETEDQLAQLQKLGVDFVQGYLFARPTEGIVFPDLPPMARAQTPSVASAATQLRSPQDEPQVDSISIPMAISKNGDAIASEPSPATTATAVASGKTANGHLETDPDRSALLKQLLNLVSDRTGYPAAMLAVEQDLEADLGIDSIKRVEILGALQKVLPASLSERVRQKMETLTRVKTLNGLADQLLCDSSASPTEPVAAPTSNGPSETDRHDLRQKLLNLVSDRTGYPAEMLGFEQDLEADLGIDSIKRVEILGALQKVLPTSLSERVKQQMETLTRVKTLNGLADQLLSNASQEASSLGKL
jgi:acyl transferase domain-containing protein/NAD(P)H-dependent flavin oxidoreductase YrpB (nitropropane dioxygenase family)/acyl carrier protein